MDVQRSFNPLTAPAFAEAFPESLRVYDTSGPHDVDVRAAT